MYFIIENNGQPLCWKSTNKFVRYGSYEEAQIDFRPQDGDVIVPICKDRCEVLEWFDKKHGIEYDAEDVLYLLDGCVAEFRSDDNEWAVFKDLESDGCIEYLRIEG